MCIRDRLTRAGEHPIARGVVAPQRRARHQLECLGAPAFELWHVGEKLRQVIDEAAGRWPVQAMAIQHRLGTLAIGEHAVRIAVSCPHRAEAFAACQYAIDRLKQVVPIWKKEYGEAGEVWVGGPTLETASSNRGLSPD